MKMKIYLDYKCYPVWIYDCDGNMIKNGLPDELEDNLEIDKMLTEIQCIYNSLFIDNEIEFRYIGFTNTKDKNEFLSKLNLAVSLLKSKLAETIKVELAE